MSRLSTNMEFLSTNMVAAYYIASLNDTFVELLKVIIRYRQLKVHDIVYRIPQGNASGK